MTHSALAAHFDERAETLAQSLKTRPHWEALGIAESASRYQAMAYMARKNSSSRP